MAACRVLGAHGHVARDKAKARTGATASSRTHGNPQHPFLPLSFLSSFAPHLQIPKKKKRKVESIIKRVIPFLHFHVNSLF